MARILLVDDDILIRKSLTRLLGSKGHEIRGASDGSEALPLVRGFDPDLVISDVDMPGMGGVALAREMQTRFPRTPFILHTGGDPWLVQQQTPATCYTKDAEALPRLIERHARKSAR